MKIFLILISLIVTTNLFAETNPPKVTTQQFQNWTYQCVEDKKRKTCEVSQNIRIQNSNINFSVVYNKFLNKDKETKKSISIIEWPEKLIEFIPEKRLNIKFSFVDDDDDLRKIILAN